MASLDSEDRITYPQTHFQIPIAVPIMPIFGNVVGNSIYSPRVQRIKDLSLQKDILRDVTASEFALRVEVSTPDPQDSTSESKTAAAIDYEKLISKLDDNLDILSRRPELNNLTPYSYGSQPIVTNSAIKPSPPSIDIDVDGYNSNNLTARILRIKEDLLLVSQNQPPKHIVNFLSEPTSEVQPGTSTTTTSSSSSSPSTSSPKRRLRILVREDGTVDWDGALAGGKEVARFGAELWERLNGKQKEEGLPSLSELFGQAQAKTMETEEIRSLSAIATESKNDVSEAIRNRDDLKVKLRQIRREGVAEIPQEDIETLRRLDIRVKELEKRLKLYTLNLDMEKVCEYIQQELEASNDPADQRLFIAEVALIDKQIMTMAAGLINMPLTGTSSSVITTTQLDMHLASLSGDTADQKITDLISLIDDDELNLICAELNDLKYRLGLDTQLAPAMDWGSLGVVVSENVNKIKVGLSYFGEGTKLLLADVQYAGVLLVKAVQGYTLKPREVNTLRRTGKDLLTLVPFTIILIIPLSPVGHVLVFSFIQRFFPDFYPSCYTEKRLNLKRLFKEIERKRDNTDVLGEEDSALFMFSNFNLAGVLQRSKLTEW
eukprot:CAMPEP_0170059044 /NCGR_PEP_ID=MMETSP0019_2-20121128/1454_1 /TAXON_ID=98059 /ORGANISM="Dinobryon sp., Strain UTEXLB2267" /LENGTH=603 /DNA_ID=CAMNT_0010264165 /DNA_START=122 /DNA_END=1930 /DNA_ORIENTATION=+